MLRYIDDIQKIGYLYAIADGSVLDKLYEEQMISKGQRIYLLNSEGVVLSSTEKDELGTVLDISGDEARVLTVADGGLWLDSKNMCLLCMQS